MLRAETPKGSRDRRPKSTIGRPPTPKCHGLSPWRTPKETGMGPPTPKCHGLTPWRAHRWADRDPPAPKCHGLTPWGVCHAQKGTLHVVERSAPRPSPSLRRAETRDLPCLRGPSGSDRNPSPGQGKAPAPPEKAPKTSQTTKDWGSRGEGQNRKRNQDPYLLPAGGLRRDRGLLHHMITRWLLRTCRYTDAPLRGSLSKSPEAQHHNTRHKEDNSPI